MWTLQGHPVDGQYQIIYADPPWKYNDQLGAAGYPKMTLAELVAMPVKELAAKDAVLFLWATWPTLPYAFGLMNAWGFEYKNCGFDWVKLNKKALTPFVGLGHWSRGNSEVCLLGARGKPHRAMKDVRQILMDEGEGLITAPIGRHSAKPPEVRDRIIRLMGDLPAVELFAREKVAGWDAFGNEIPPETSVQLAPQPGA